MIPSHSFSARHNQVEHNRPSTPIRLETGTITAKIGGGLSGNFVYDTQNHQAVKSLRFSTFVNKKPAIGFDALTPIHQVQRVIDNNALREITMNLALKKAAEKYPKLESCLVLLEKWDVSLSHFLKHKNKDEARIVFSMPKLNMMTLNDFLAKDTPQNAANTLRTSADRFFEGLKILFDLGFIPADVDENIFIINHHDQLKIAFADFQYYCTVNGSEAQGFRNQAFQEVNTLLKDRMVELELPSIEEVFEKSLFPCAKDIIEGKITLAKIYQKPAELIQAFIESATGISYSTSFA